MQVKNIFAWEGFKFSSNGDTVDPKTPQNQKKMKTTKPLIGYFTPFLLYRNSTFLKGPFYYDMWLTGFGFKCKVRYKYNILLLS